MKKWYELYTKKNSSSQQKVIPDSTFSLIKFFKASDTALEQFVLNMIQIMRKKIMMPIEILMIIPKKALPQLMTK